MKFTARDDVDAPREAVFGVLTDGVWFESLALNRGAEVRRLVGNGPVTPGSKWEAEFRFRGKPRLMTVEAVDVTSPERIILRIDSEGLATDVALELASLAGVRTRLTSVTKLEPKSLSARLFVQSMKFTRGATEKRFRTRTSQFAEILAGRASS